MIVFLAKSVSGISVMIELKEVFADDASKVLELGMSVIVESKELFSEDISKILDFLGLYVMF